MVCPRQFYSWQLAKSQVICQRQFHSWELSKIQAVCPRQLHFWNSLITMRFAQDTCKHITFLSYSWILTSQAFRIIAIGLPQSRSCILSAPSPPRYDRRTASAVQGPFFKACSLYWVIPRSLSLSVYSWTVKQDM